MSEVISEESILLNSAISILLFERRSTNRFVVGVPHHAPLGKATLPCPDHTNSDENAGIIGRQLANILNCHSVIASNYMFDVNKSRESRYYKVISRWAPSILVEVHGHGGDSAKFDIEISSGSRQRSSWSEALAQGLEFRLRQISSLRGYSISGEFDKIYFKATHTATITTDQWLSFHIELPKKLRSSSKQLSGFCGSLARSLNDVSEKYQVESSGDPDDVSAI
jgi:hypothetical protein